MNIEQAKAVSISLILDKINCKPQRQINQEFWYLSPLRNERSASFKIHTGKNVWYDFGEGKGGDTIAFACEYLRCNNEAYTVSDALRWIENMSGQGAFIKPVKSVDENYKEDKSLIIKDVKTIEHRLLINYLHQRGIELTLAQNYLKEIRIYNKQTKKSFFALGFCNEENEYEIRNPFFKGCLGTKAITFIRGTIPKPEGIHIFEGFMDYLSVLSQKHIKKLNDDAIILNSLSCLKQATPYIKGYGYCKAYTWMDNDKSGRHATQVLKEFFITENDLQHIQMNKAYASHKDVNAWHQYKLGR